MLDGPVSSFVYPQFLSCGRCRNHLPSPARRGTMQTIQNRQNAPRPCRDPGKGRRAFLTTEPTTYSPGAHGKPAFKECYRVRESERKRPKISKKHQKKCFSSLRVQEAVGSNPATRTMRSVLIGSEYPTKDTPHFLLSKLGQRRFHRTAANPGCTGALPCAG